MNCFILIITKTNKNYNLKMQNSDYGFAIEYFKFLKILIYGLMKQVSLEIA